MRGNNLDTAYFIQAIKDLTRESGKLPRTLAYIKKINDEGYTVDVELFEKTLGLQEYKNIPVIKNKYYNTPIAENDLVILLTLSHLLGNYLETKTLDKVLSSETYLALPFVLKTDFEFKNEFALVTPDKEFMLHINKDEISIKSNKTLEILATASKLDITTDDIGIKSNNGLTIEAGSSLDISSKSSLSIESSNALDISGSASLNIEGGQLSLASNTPISIGNNAATLGSLLQELIQFFTTATTGPLAPSGTTTTINPAQLADLAAILAKIKGVFK